MKEKICKICNKKYPATLEYYHKQTKGKYGLRSVCKICSKKVAKEYRKRPESKEKHRISMAKWREENPKHLREINRRCYNKNKDIINAKKRERRKTDPEYKAKFKEYDKKYVESGRRYEMNNKPEQREKARLRSKIRRNTPEKYEKDKVTNAKWRDNNRESIIENGRKKRENLEPSYVAQCMKIKVADLYPEILETKKIIINIKRELKSNNVKIR